MDRDEQIASLRLIRTPNIGQMTFSLLLQRYGSARAALDAVPELARRGGRSLKPASRAAATAEIEAVEAAAGQPADRKRVARCPPVTRHRKGN